MEVFSTVNLIKKINLISSMYIFFFRNEWSKIQMFDLE
jgi:hypothetical protein